MTLEAPLATASSLILPQANSLTFELGLGANLTLIGFTIHSASPLTSVPPESTNYTHGWAWANEGVTVHGLFGTVLPYIMSFSSMLKDQSHSLSRLVLKDMVIVYDTCGLAWSTVATLIAQPPGVSHCPDLMDSARLALSVSALLFDSVYTP